jgi:hypothetical protein
MYWENNESSALKLLRRYTTYITLYDTLSADRSNST